MSVKELILQDNPITIKVGMAANIDGAVVLRVSAPHANTIAVLDRNQASLLLLYLREHLELQAHSTEMISPQP